MSAEIIPLLTKALGETVYMVIISMAFASIIGVPLGVLLHTTDKGQILENAAINQSIGSVVNAVRSIPFIILMVAIIPLTRFIVGSAIGTTAAIVPLVIASIPFIGRQLPEAMPSIVSQLTTVIIALVGESAMAGAIGGGGLGDLAIRYGYQRFRPEVMLATVVILIVLVQAVQFAGNSLSKYLNKR